MSSSFFLTPPAEADQPVSKTIREEFSESTILTIAHRIHTIVSTSDLHSRGSHGNELLIVKIDFDKVLVMDKGEIAEYASPAELLRNHKSKFYAVSLHERSIRIIQPVPYHALLKRMTGYWIVVIIKMP